MLRHVIKRRGTQHESVAEQSCSYNPRINSCPNVLIRKLAVLDNTEDNIEGDKIHMGE